MDAESLLDSVGMAHWLRQEDEVPEYEDMLTKAELLEWVRLLQSVWLAPDLPVSFFFFLMESTISTSSSLWLGGIAMVAYFCQATIFQWYIGPLAL